MDEKTKKDMINFIQENSNYYITKFEQMKKYKKYISWNWSSFLFSPLWFIYRKMYAYGFSLILLSFLLSFIGALYNIFIIILPIICGLFSNYIYLKYVEINLVKINHLDDIARYKIIANNGGVNLLSTLVFTLVIVLFSY